MICPLSVRASALSLREQVMVEGARAVGAGTPRILLRYILPALVAPLIVQGTYICASAILVAHPHVQPRTLRRAPPSGLVWLAIWPGTESAST
ncbi:MAG: hypothetical protein HYU24_10970 [Candidatus Rokubacteria bacterium]|nr:hypothetical protein [Candidatus Rokubacteria bacterium]